MRFWTRLGFINFGGPTGQIAIMYQELVERRHWVDQGQFFHALNFAMLQPGPEAHQLAIYVAWILNGAPAVVAGTLFIAPALVLMIALSWLYATHDDVTWVAAIFHGLAWAVVGIVGAALVQIGVRAVGTGLLVAVAVAAFLSLHVYGVPYPLVVIGAGGPWASWAARCGRAHSLCPEGRKVTSRCQPSAFAPRSLGSHRGGRRGMAALSRRVG